MLMGYVGSFILIDSHCHIDFSQFDCDRHAVLKRCESKGMAAIIIPGVSESQWFRAQDICEEHACCYYSVGIHPWYITEAAGNSAKPPNADIECLWAGLEAAAWHHLGHPKCLAVGESGLDTLIETSFERQKAVFKAHIELANAQGKPLIVHSRKAHPQVMEMLKKHSAGAGGVIHGFSGSYEQAREFARLGFLIGVGGTITYERAKKTRDAICRLPKEALVLETDAPDMPLSGRQGERNSPEYLPEIVDYLSQLRGEDPKDIISYTSKNSGRLFGLLT